MEYYVAKGNQQTGPFAYEAMATAGINAETLVWATGWPTWKPASQVPELAAILQGSTPPPIPAQVTLGGATVPPPLPMAPAPMQQPRRPGGGNPMFRGVRAPGYPSPAAPVSHVVSQPAPQSVPSQAPVPVPSQPAPQSVPSQAPASVPVQPAPAEETSVVAADASDTSTKDKEEEGTYKPSLTCAWMWQSIAMALLCFPLGLVPLYFSLQTKKANDVGDTELAKGLSEQTLKYLKIVLIVGGVLWTIFSYFAWKIDAAS